jgi:Ca-activated chloride channel family protein
MRALDFTVDGKRANRLAAIKDVASDFIEERPGDRLGMVVFGEEAFTQAPLTLDHDLLKTLLDRLEIGVAGDATAIGQAIGVGINRLKDLTAKSKVMILLTDGQNNAGDLPPLKAADIAASFGIKIYTIGVGTLGPAPFEVDSLFGKRIVYQEAHLDEPTLKKIAETTQARYFRATDTNTLKEIYAEINRLEKSQALIKEYTEYDELYQRFLIWGLLILLGEILLSRTIYRRIP